MGSVNKVIILGRLGKDPEYRVTPTQQEVCTLSIATSESWTKDGQKVEKTEWHKVVLWGQLAGLANKYLKKGRNVYIEGKLQTRSWDDQASGQKKYITEIIGTQMTFVDSQRESGSDNAGDSYGAPEYPGTPSYEEPNFKPSSVGDDVPF